MERSLNRSAVRPTGRSGARSAALPALRVQISSVADRDGLRLEMAAEPLPLASIGARLVAELACVIGRALAQNESESEAMRPADSLDEKSWLVWVDGADTVGPVSARQIARGIRAGKVPTDASVQRAGDVWWSGVLDEPEVIEALKSV